MRRHAEGQATRPVSWTRLDTGLSVTMLVVAAIIRLAYARAVVFPALDDPAFYLATARNLVLGRGLEVDVLWSYQVPFNQVTHPSHEHWMPLPTLLIAVPFALEQLLDASPDFSLALARLPGLILGAMLAPLTYAWGRHLVSAGHAPRWLALGAGLLVATNATLAYQSASADSSAPFALFAAWALIGTVGKAGSRVRSLGTGLLMALAYLARSDGLLLLAVPLLCLVLPLGSGHAADKADGQSDGPRRAWPGRSSPADLVYVFAAFGLVIMPWLVRNTLALGTPLPGSVLKQAWLSDYVQTFNYLAPATPRTLLAQGWPAILSLRGQALFDGARVFLLSTFPWGLLALPGAWLLRRRWRTYPHLVYGLLLFAGLALVFPVASMSGTIYHSQGAIFPFAALAAVYAVYRAVLALLPRPRQTGIVLAILLGGVLVLSLSQTWSARTAVGERHQAEQAQYEAIARWLGQRAAPSDVIMTTQPYSVHWASGHPCIALPAGQPPSVALQAAERYDARWLVVTQAFGRYPAALHEEPNAGFVLAGSEAGSEFYEIQIPGRADQ